MSSSHNDPAGKSPISKKVQPPLSLRATSQLSSQARQINAGPLSLSYAPLLLLLGSLAVMILAAVSATAVAVIYLWQSDQIVPGVDVLDIDLGGQTTAEAETMLATFWNEQLVLLELEDEHWSAAPASLGVTFDPAATVEAAYRHGRSTKNILTIIRTRRAIKVPPVWIFEEAAAKAYLSDLALEVAIPPIDASAKIIDGKVVTTQPVTGRQLDISATLAGLAESPSRAIAAGRLPLVTQPVEPSTTDVSMLVDEANRLLSSVVVVEAFEPLTGQVMTWSIPPAVWGNWLSLKIREDESGQFKWTVDPEAAGSYLQEQILAMGSAGYLDLETVIPELVDAIAGQKPSVSARLFHRPTQHIVQSGDTLARIGRDRGIPYPWIQEMNPNLGNSLSVGQTISIPSPDRFLPLPIVREKRILVSISRQRMWVYEEGRLKWEWPASTGIDTSPTAPGVFQIQSQEPEAYAGNWDLWMPYFMGIYRPVPTSGFMNGFHGFPTRNGTDLLWTGDLGRKVTYGCILISTVNAADLFDWAEAGVIVEIRP